MMRLGDLLGCIGDHVSIIDVYIRLENYFKGTDEKATICYFYPMSPNIYNCDMSDFFALGGNKASNITPEFRKYVEDTIEFIKANGNLSLLVREIDIGTYKEEGDKEAHPGLMVEVCSVCHVKNI
jgi:hypothetical protein